MHGRMGKRKTGKNPKSARAIQSRKIMKPTDPAPLLVVDQKPFLKKLLTQCRRLRTELRKKQERLRKFEEVEMAAYERWYHSEFGSLLTEIREMKEEIGSLEYVFDHLEWYSCFRPEKLEEIHSELMRRLREGTLYSFVPPTEEEEGESEDEEDDDEFEDEEDWGEFQEAAEAFRKAFESAFGGGANASEDEQWRNKTIAGRSPSSADGAVKSLYRTLAKRLHPDHSDLESPVRERRWHELQTAYEDGDLEALQRIEAVCDMEVGGLSLRLGLARLRDLAAYHRSHVEPLRHALRQVKRHPAFNFEAAERGTMRERSRSELTRIRKQLHEQKVWLLYQIEEITEIQPAETCQSVSTPRHTVAPVKPSEKQRTDKDVWDNYDAWREEEERCRSASESNQ